jgi:predicted secreted protein
MKMTTSFIASLLLALTLTTAHGASTSSYTFPEQPTINERSSCLQGCQTSTERPVTLLLHENNSGAKVTIPTGTLIKVILKSQASSTGFKWTASTSPILELLNTKIGKPLFDTIGSPYKEYWTFRAAAPGQATLIFSLARPWEKESLPQKEIQFDISVEELP